MRKGVGGRLSVLQFQLAKIDEQICDNRAFAFSCLCCRTIREDRKEIQVTQGGSNRISLTAAVVATGFSDGDYF